MTGFAPFSARSDDHFHTTDGEPIKFTFKIGEPRDEL